MSWNGPRIEEHGIIGDLHSTALVGCDGGINFMCFPHFDSPAMFARLLDPEEGGTFRICPDREGFTPHQLYLPDTNILLTRFLSDEGIVELCDFMPVEETGPVHNIVRIVRCVRGEVNLNLLCAPRFDFGRAKHEVHAEDGQVVFEPKGRDLVAVRLHVPVEHRVTDAGAVHAHLHLAAGEEVSFVLEEATRDRSPAYGENFAKKAFERTVEFWRRWVSRSKYDGRWREMVNRSALTLKLMTSQRHGSIIAAPTLGLPEAAGGVRNWDYRYTWIRDAALCLREFLALGHTEEAEAFMCWLSDRIEASEDGELRPMYQLDGSEVPPEEELDLRGYLDSRPVRVGNDAGNQLQLDLYGPLFDAILQYERKGGTLSHDLWNQLVKLAEWVSANWERPDEGIWEVRGGKKHFVHSRVMCWVALDRATRLARNRSLPAPVEAWREVRDDIYRDVYEHFWSDELQAFVQRSDNAQLDAATLLMPQVQFVGGTDPRWTSTLEAIDEALVEDALVWRYRQSDEQDDVDPMPADEGSFTICSFWLVECLSRSGQVERARLMFEKMLGYSNHVGLYAEQLGFHGEHLGNFPQAFTHIGLITAAMELDCRIEKRNGLY